MRWLTAARDWLSYWRREHDRAEAVIARYQDEAVKADGRANEERERFLEMKYDRDAYKRESERLREDLRFAQRRADQALMAMANVGYGSAFGYFPFRDGPMPPERLKPRPGEVAEEPGIRMEDLMREETEKARDDVAKWMDVMFNTKDKE